jgi:hypothetical protein
MDKSLSAAERFDALKFVIHFVGDIHQPLHDEAINVGGNTINVTLFVYSTSMLPFHSNKNQ